MAKPCRFAAVGDVHGQFGSMVCLLQRWEADHSTAIDFVLQVGDLEAHRHEADLQTMAAPSKHRVLGDFHRVMSGELRLPWPVFFIGGNHEPYGWLEEHPEGFELCPNLHYLGRAGVHRIGPLRVAALSGIHRLETYAVPRPHVSLMGCRSNKDFIGFVGHEVGHLMAEAEGAADTVHQLRSIFAALQDSGRLGVLQLLPIAAELQRGASEAESRKLLNKITKSQCEQATEEQFVQFFDALMAAWPIEKREVLLRRLGRVRATAGSASGEAASAAAAAAATISRGGNSISSESCGDSWGGDCKDPAPVVDVLMTHDWPRGISSRAADNSEELWKPVGNEPCRELLEHINPTLMLCGHMHVPFRCVVGKSAVRCMSKVPSIHSVAVFEVPPVQSNEKGQMVVGGQPISEMYPCDPLPASRFAEANSDVDSDDDKESTMA